MLDVHANLLRPKPSLHFFFDSQDDETTVSLMGKHSPQNDQECIKKKLSDVMGQKKQYDKDIKDASRQDFSLKYVYWISDATSIDKGARLASTTFWTLTQQNSTSIFGVGTPMR